MKFFSKESSGFTLIELLVVIAIIGILSSVVLASLNSAREKSRDARRIGDVKQLQLALEMYYDSNSSYPNALTDLVSTYIPVIPLDPSSNNSYLYATGPTDYVILADLETNHSALDSDVDDMVNGLDCMGDGTIYCVKP
tara:strand:+ start:9386 stop:9802 length:417 start_codon:yes stop_codon:yes gene_type:complete